MRWEVKAAIQATLSRVPMGHRLQRRLQDVTGSSRLDIEAHYERKLRFLRAVRGIADRAAADLGLLTAECRVRLGGLLARAVSPGAPPAEVLKPAEIAALNPVNACRTSVAEVLGAELKAASRPLRSRAPLPTPNV